MQTGFIYDGISSLLHSCVLNASRCTGKERDAESGLDYFGARYYASSMGRWMSPDWKSKPEPVPYASLDNPQTFNLYSYVGNNPLSKADADGHCSSPSVGKGQVGVCIDYYISTKTVDPCCKMGYLGYGDNRGPMANDTENRYRVEIKLVIENGQLVHSATETDVAGISRTKIGPPLQGTETTTPTMTMDDKGNMHIDLQTTGVNGYQANGLPGPAGVIQGDVKLVVTADGKVGTDAGGSRTAYPSLEIYKYQQGHDPTKILNMPQSNDSKDLTRGQTQQIPQVQPQ